MKNTPTISRIAIFTGLALGAFALAAIADWTPAPPNPPSNNVDAPINVGSSWQSKSGQMTVGSSPAVCLRDASNNCITLDVEGTGIFSGDVSLLGKLDVTGIITAKNNLLIRGILNYKPLNATPTDKYVLTTDGNGNATWQAPASASLQPGTIGGWCVGTVATGFAAIPTYMSPGAANPISCNCISGYTYFITQTGTIPTTRAICVRD